jgi:hypothetical protein
VPRAELKSRYHRALLLCALLALVVFGAQATAFAQAGANAQPRVQLNFVNTCRPAPPEIEQLKRALARVNEPPHFSSDFEIARGQTLLSGEEALAAGLPADAPPTPSSWIRIRHDFPEKAALLDAQYSLSVQAGEASETLALHLRDSREALEVWISTSAAGGAAEMLKAETPPERIRVERYGKPSIVLARCAAADQSAYEPIFLTAGEILHRYRAAMAVATVAPSEFARLPGANESKAAGANH